MIRCYNCGANIDENEVICPYCNASQHDAAEKKYMNDLYSMNDTMDKMDDNALRIELRTTLKRSLIMIGIFAVCIAIGSGIGVAEYKSNHDSSKERKDIIASYEWYDNNIDKLNQMYAAKDFEGMDEYLSSAGIYKNAKAVKYWEHYPIYRLYSLYYRGVLNYIKDDYYLSHDTAYMSAYRYCVELMAEKDNCLKNTDGIYRTVSQEDMAIADEWCDKTVQFVYNNLKVTSEEFEEDIRNNYVYSYDDLKQRAAIYYNRVK